MNDLMVPVPGSGGVKVNARLFRPRRLEGREVLVCQTCDRVLPAPTVEATLTETVEHGCRVLELETSYANVVDLAAYRRRRRDREARKVAR